MNIKARPDKVVDDIIIDVKTTAKANPNIKKRHDNALLCLKYFAELGLSPLARARAGIRGANAKQEENIFLKFMERNDND